MIPLSVISAEINRALRSEISHIAMCSFLAVNSLLQVMFPIFEIAKVQTSKKRLHTIKKIGIAPYFKNLLLHLLQVILNPSYFTVIFDELLNNFFRKEQMRFNLLG